MSAWTCRSTDGKADHKIVPPRLRIPCWKGLGADSEEKHEPVSDIDTIVVDGLKALDPEWSSWVALLLVFEGRHAGGGEAIPLRRFGVVLRHALTIGAYRRPR